MLKGQVDACGQLRLQIGVARPVGLHFGVAACGVRGVERGPGDQIAKAGCTVAARQAQAKLVFDCQVRSPHAVHERREHTGLVANLRVADGGAAHRANAFPAQAGMGCPVGIDFPLVLAVNRQALAAGQQGAIKVAQGALTVLQRAGGLVALVGFELQAADQVVLVGNGLRELGAARDGSVPLVRLLRQPIGRIGHASVAATTVKRLGLVMPLALTHAGVDRKLGAFVKLVRPTAGSAQQLEAAGGAACAAGVRQVAAALRKQTAGLARALGHDEHGCESKRVATCTAPLQSRVGMQHIALAAGIAVHQLNLTATCG